MSYKALSAIKEHVEIETIKNLSPQQVNEVFNKQAARIKELEVATRDLVKPANWRSKKISQLQEEIEDYKDQIKSLKVESERLKELMSGLVHWNNQGHIDQSFWDAAAQLTDPTTG